ncbi:MAG: hypothetical protein AAF467_02820 [Actinomycetota bacterium]
MTIRKGEEWGYDAEPGPHVVQVRDDADLAQRAHDSVRGGQPLIARLGAGDLLATLGGSPPQPGRLVRHLPIDLGLIVVDDGDPLPFVSHCVLRRRAWQGQSAVVMNAGWLGPYYLGPKAHPNDGILDITWGALGWNQRLLARRRAKTGSHLPHPALTTARVATWEWTAEQPVRLYTDGVAAGPRRVRSVAVSVVPDAFTVVLG